MTQVRTLRLDPRLWRSLMSEFIYSCAASTSHEQADRIREVHYLLRSAPESMAAFFPDEQALEDLLAADAHESAALLLLGEKRGFMLSRGAYGVSLATIVGPGGDGETSAEGRTPALALMAALASTLLAEAEQQLRPRSQSLSKVVSGGSSRETAGRV